MTYLWRFGALIVGPGILVCLTMVGYALVDAYLLGHCSAKFGCAFNLGIAVYVSLFAALCSSIGVLPVCFAFRTMICEMPISWVVASVVAIALGQGALLASGASLMFGDTRLSMVTSHSIFSFILALVVLYGVKRWMYGKTWTSTSTRI